jgi:hypothetical protein
MVRARTPPTKPFRHLAGGLQLLDNDTLEFVTVRAAWVTNPWGGRAGPWPVSRGMARAWTGA